MDKRTALAFVLIFLIILLWPFYQQIMMPPPPSEPIVPDEEISGKTIEPEVEKEQATVDKPKIKIEEIQIEKEKLIKVDTDLYTGVISTRGGTIKNWVLKEYKKKDDSQLDLIKDQTAENLGIGFITIDGDSFNLSKRSFEPVGIDIEDSTYLNFDELGKAELHLICRIDYDKYVEKTMIFEKDKYPFKMDVRFVGLDNFIADREYWVSWGCGLSSSESKLGNEMKYSKIYAMMGDEVESLDPKDPEGKTVLLTGETRWIAVSIKYFAGAIIPENFYGKEALISGRVKRVEKELIDKDFYGVIKAEFSEEEVHQDSYKIFIGPLEYPMISGFNVGLQKIMGLGWGPLRPISKLIYHTLRFLYSFIGNYGVVIIIFSIIIKILFFPLTRSSYLSMKKMQSLQPLIAELREKYKKDPQKLNKATMRLYKEQGVNPLGGCLPLLLQMPVFIAMYPLFYQMIEFRGAKFIWWIKDLSSPDTVAKLNLGLIDWNLNILPIIWVVSMYIQNRLTMKDPKQKMMVYLMPIMMLIFFNNLFSSGLVLYWTVFNILTMFQQFSIQRKSK